MYTPKFNQVSDRAILIEAMQAYSFAILIGPLGSTRKPQPAPRHASPSRSQRRRPARRPRRPLRQSQSPLAISRQSRNPRRLPRSAQLRQPLALRRRAIRPHLELHRHPRLRHALRSSKTMQEKTRFSPASSRPTTPPTLEQWRNLPDGFRRTMLAGIVGFRIPITRIEGKFKISQNRPEVDRHAVQAAHSAGTPDQQALASWMQRLIG